MRQDELPRNGSGCLVVFCANRVPLKLLVCDVNSRVLCAWCSTMCMGFHGQGRDALAVNCTLRYHIIIGRSDFKPRRRAHDNYVNRRTPGVWLQQQGPCKPYYTVYTLQQMPQRRRNGVVYLPLRGGSWYNLGPELCRMRCFRPRMSQNLRRLYLKSL